MKSDREKIAEVIAKLDNLHEKIDKFAHKVGYTYDSLMSAADLYLSTGEVIEDSGTTGYNQAAWYSGDWAEFWDLYEQIRGIQVSDKHAEWIVCNC